MRSSVSVILSSPTPDTNMSHPDYDQNAHDHAALLILVKQTGEEISVKSFNKIYDRISKITALNILDSNGIERKVKARYMRDYLVGNNDWGDFQTHRRLYGLITVGKCSTQLELNEVCRIHESLKVKYTNTLYDSRSIIMGVNHGPNTPSFPTPSNFKSRAIFYPNDGELENLESHVTEFLSTLFWVLESKRHERCREKIDKVSLLLAPFERRDFVGLDMESRSNRKRSLGRMTKHLGDLSLQAGLPGDALTHYQTAADILRSINDWLWLAGSLEGQCAASALIHYPHLGRGSPIKKNSSLPETQPRASQDSKQPKDVVDPCIVEQKTVINLLTPDDIIKYYREAIVHYSKYQNAGVIETEACYKAARLAIQHKAYLHAANFLHSVILINLALNEEEKIERLMTLSELYTKIGFQRKASFYRRLAATRYVSARNPQTNWQQCYNLMLQALQGHRLSLDPEDHSPDQLSGWPGLQKQVLQDLVLAATRVGQSAVATRHMTFLLQVMWGQLSAAERHECAAQLQSLASQCEGAPVPLVLDSGLVIAPVNLINVPTLIDFTVQNLKQHLRPTKLEKSKENFGPFLFTPINFGSLERKANNKNNNKVDYLWVADEICEVKLELSNPFPIELEVSNMRLLTSGVVFESLPLTVVLPPDATNVAVLLTGTPKEVGQLEISGYSTHVLGVKSNCRLKKIPKIGTPVFNVDVIPALPFLEITTQLPKKTNNGVRLSLYAGESVDCQLELRNTGQLPLQWLEVSLECLHECDRLITWDVEPLLAALPLPPGSSANLIVNIFAAASFLSTSGHQDVVSSPKSSIFSSPSSFLSSASTPRQPDRFLAKSPSFKSGGSSLNSFTSQLSKICVENSPKALQCHLKVRYSSDPAMSAGYCRVSVFTFTIEINHSVYITNWDVIPAEISSQFYLVLDIANMTSQELELKYGANKSLLMEENESCRIPIPVERCPLTRLGEVLRAGESVSELMELNKSCGEHIASLVDLSWSLAGGGGRGGRASLHGIALSLNMLDVVRMSPVNWEVLINGKKVEPQDEISSQVGQSMVLGVNVHNSLSWALNDLELSVRFFQDYQNGTTNYQLDTRVACSGATCVTLDEVPEHGQAYHECVVVFLTFGQYKVDVQCVTKEKHLWKLSPPLVFQVSKR